MKHVMGTNRRLVEGWKPLDPVKDKQEIARRQLRALLRERRRLKGTITPGVEVVIRSTVAGLLQNCRKRTYS